ncbi:MAG: type II toxin-antitoxin system PemK/MazF family toxin, partial [bacterium]|nr:type II toxin-antitoxin system PemK/MazF family toxin [bacterium]
PVLILGRAEILPSLSQVPVIPLSSQLRGLPWEVELLPADGLPSVSVLKPEWMRSVERTRLGAWITSLPDNRWPEVRDALLHVLGLDP